MLYKRTNLPDFLVKTRETKRGYKVELKESPNFQIKLKIIMIVIAMAAPILLFLNTISILQLLQFKQLLPYKILYHIIPYYTT